MIPRRVQIALRRRIARYKRSKYADVWPIDPRAGKEPENWRGWPDGKKFALVLSHDVDTAKGYKNVLKLAELEEDLGFRSTFNFVPERYGKISLGLLDELRRRGFAVGVHGLKHDGKLFSSKEVFRQRAPRINEYLEQWGTRGFTTPSMIRNHEWMHELNIDYCVSTFDTDPFEPQSDGVATIFPFLVYRNSDQHGSSPSSFPASQLPSCVASQPSSFQASELPSFFVELPYTLPQDFTLFVILGENGIDIWKQKLDWIASNGGMALLNSHPDYMNLTGDRCGLEEYPVEYYADLLVHIKDKYRNQYWHARADEIAFWWKTGLVKTISNK